MKKNFIFIIFVIALFTCSGFIPVLQAAEITYLKGNVQGKFPPEEIWRRAELGMKIDIGDSIKTARRSRADILVDEKANNFIVVEENTLLNFNSTSPGQVNKIDLSEGKVLANIEKLKEGLAFEVTTPSSVAGVRGTGLSVKSGKEGDEVTSYENDVVLKAYDQNGNLISEIVIPAGFKAIVERFGLPGELIQLSEQEMERWNELRQEVLDRLKEGDREKIEETIEKTMEEINKFKEQIEERGIEEDIEEREEYYYEEW